MKHKYVISNKSVYNIGYHIVWCPKYRRSILVDSVKTDMEDLLIEKSADMGFSIEHMEVMPDHIHLFVKADPSFAPHEIVKGLKGYTSNRLRKKYDHLRTKLPTLWSNSYFISTIGFVSETVIRTYIAKQRGK